MNASELAAKIAARHTCVQGLFAAHCQTGERYVSLGFENWESGREYLASPRGVDRIIGPATDGIVREFAPRRCYETEAEACDDLLKAFDLYEAGYKRAHPGAEDSVVTLYWRYAAPHIFWHAADAPNGLGYIRTRLVLSSRPVVFADDADYGTWRTKQLTAEIQQEHDNG